MTRYNNVSVQSNDANYNNLNAKYETYLFSQTQNIERSTSQHMVVRLKAGKEILKPLL